MRKWLFLFLLLSIVACKNKKGEEKLIPRKDYVALLVDLHITDAMALNHTINENFGRLDSALLYHAALESYGYTKEQLINTMTYYSGDSEKLVGIYDDVFSILSKRADEAKELYSSTTVSRSHKIWKSPKNLYLIRGDTLDYPPPFDFSIDSTGTFALSASIKITNKDSSFNPRIVAYFYNPDDDTEESREYFDVTPLLKANYTREYTIIKEKSDPQLSRMRIILPQQDNTDSVFTKNIEIRNLWVTKPIPKR